MNCIRLSHCTSAEVSAYLQRHDAILIPIGSTEQHGPSGVLGTDTICAEAVALAAAERAQLLVGPPLALTVAQFNLGFAGTIAVRASVVQALIHDYLVSLAHHGFRHFYFVNGHGANVAVANAAFQDLYLERSLRAREDAGPALRCRLRSWWEFDEVNRLRQALYAEAEGLHATPSEISLAQLAVPETVRDIPVSPEKPLSAAYMRDHAGDRHFDAHEHRAMHPRGPVGSHPGLACAEHGAQLLAAAAGAVVSDFEYFVSAEDRG
jgi:creatinine amidohydrolase